MDQSTGVTFNHVDWIGTERARTNPLGELCLTTTSQPYGDAAVSSTPSGTTSCSPTPDSCRQAAGLLQDMLEVDPASRPWPGAYSTGAVAASGDECRVRGGLTRRTKCSSGHHRFWWLDHCAETVCPQPQRRVSSSSTRNPSVSAASIVCRLCGSSGCLHMTFLPMFEDDRAKAAREWREFLVLGGG